jgi:VanZ family protein
MRLEVSISREHEMTPWNWFTAATMFFAYVTLDALYAINTEAVSRYQAGRAAWSAALLYSLSAYGVQVYVENHLYVIPLVLGASIGTYFTVRILKTRRSKEPHGN